jgi:endonuclease/exonuclease/phosphatase family metal-dependent hydrolase
MYRNLELKHGSVKERKPELRRRFSDHVPLLVEVEM